MQNEESNPTKPVKSIKNFKGDAVNGESIIGGGVPVIVDPSMALDADPAFIPPLELDGSTGIDNSPLKGKDDGSVNPTAL